MLGSSAPPMPSFGVRVGGFGESHGNGGGSSGGEGAGQVVCGPGHKATYTATSATPICAACSLGQW